MGTQPIPRTTASINLTELELELTNLNIALALNDQIYLLVVQCTIFELLIYAKNGIWHPELFNPTTLHSFRQNLNQNFIGLKLWEVIKFR